MLCVCVCTCVYVCAHVISCLNVYTVLIITKECLTINQSINRSVKSIRCCLTSEWMRLVTRIFLAPGQSLQFTFWLFICYCTILMCICAMYDLNGCVVCCVCVYVACVFVQHMCLVQFTTYLLMYICIHMCVYTLCLYFIYKFWYII